MRVLFLGLAFPKMDKNQYLYPQLVQEFHDHGHDILVVAPAYDQAKTGLQEESGISVIRVTTMKLFKVGMLQKGIANVLLPYQYKKALIASIQDLSFDLIITPTPPITMYSVVKWLKSKGNSRIYLILRDIFPQNAVDLGLMNKTSPIYAYFKRKEKKLYAISDSIGCMSPGNIEYVKKHNQEVSFSKLHLLANWGNTLPIMPEDEQLKFRSEMGFSNKFLVVFGGNIGLPQKMDNIVDLAAACQDYPNIHFLIYGQGSEKEALKKRIEQDKLTNLELRDSVAQRTFFKIMQTADVGLISLSQKFSIPNIPSKSLVYFNAKKPILASIDKNTDYGSILEQTCSGLWSEAGNTQAFKENLLKLYDNPKLAKEMGINGYMYMQQELNSKKAYDTVVEATW